MFTVLPRRDFDARMIMAEKRQLRYLNLICTFRDPVLGQQRSSFFFVKSWSEIRTLKHLSVAGKPKLKPLKEGLLPLQLTCNAFKCLFRLFRVILGLSACEVGATLPVNVSFNVQPKLGDRRN